MAMLTTADRRSLLVLARRSVTARATGGRRPAVPPIPDLCAGGFVTIRRAGELRGCIGSLETDRPIGEVVERCAASAASEDPRFPPVQPAELGAIEVEISVLGPLETVDPVDPARIVVGRDGLVVEQGPRRGLLLPQVATEWGWDAETFLGRACLKAGLPREAWRTGARVFRFEALVFGEHEGEP